MTKEKATKQQQKACWLSISIAIEVASNKLLHEEQNLRRKKYAFIMCVFFLCVCFINSICCHFSFTFVRSAAIVICTSNVLL